MSDDPFSDEGFVARFEMRRCQHDSVNNCVDEPAIVRRVQSLGAGRVLELGCATGRLTLSLAQHCQHVTAIDRSQVMLGKARSLVSESNVEFVQSSFDDFLPSVPYDLIVSGMTMHLVDDFEYLCGLVFNWLNPGGYFLFTQRHPIRTANPTGDLLGVNKNGWFVSDYFLSGRRCYNWLDADVVYFHRAVGEIVNIVIKSGYEILEVSEPKPDIYDETARVAENNASPSVLLLLCRRPFC